jgi:hypothetical protein
LKVVQFLLFVLMAMTGVIAFFTLGPMTETKFWPVYGKFRIVDMDDLQDGLRIVARFEKKRNCDPQGYGWYLGEFGIMKQVVTRSGDLVVHRPIGIQLGTFFIKDLTTKDVPYLYAEVYHHCHPLWITRTIIYP